MSAALLAVTTIDMDNVEALSVEINVPDNNNPVSLSDAENNSVPATVVKNNAASKFSGNAALCAPNNAFFKCHYMSTPFNFGSTSHGWWRATICPLAQVMKLSLTRFFHSL